MSPHTKPPIGIAPRWWVTEQRVIELRSAIARYVIADQAIPPEWIAELRDHREWLREYRHPRPATVVMTIQKYQLLLPA